MTIFIHLLLYTNMYFIKIMTQTHQEHTHNRQI